MSTTYIAQLAQFIGFLLTLAGIGVGVNDLVVTITTLITVISGAWVFIGRWRAGGITLLGFRTDK